MWRGVLQELIDGDISSLVVTGPGEQLRVESKGLLLVNFDAVDDKALVIVGFFLAHFNRFLLHLLTSHPTPPSSSPPSSRRNMVLWSIISLVYLATIVMGQNICAEVNVCCSTIL